MNSNINDFKKQIKPIIDSSVIGIKGRCKIENNLSFLRKIKCMFD